MASACWFGAGICCSRTKVSENCYVSTTEKTIFRGDVLTTEPHRTARKQEVLNQQLAQNMNKGQITINQPYKEVNN